MLAFFPKKCFFPSWSFLHLSIASHLPQSPQQLFILSFPMLQNRKRRNSPPSEDVWVVHNHCQLIAASLKVNEHTRWFSEKSICGNHEYMAMVLESIQPMCCGKILWQSFWPRLCGLTECSNPFKVWV